MRLPRPLAKVDPGFVGSAVVLALVTAGVFAGCSAPSSQSGSSRSSITAAQSSEGSSNSPSPGVSKSETGASASHDGLVGYPSFLPRRTLHFHSDSLIVGTADKPALTSEGDPVKVVTPLWSVVAVVAGPEVPGEGLPYQAPVTTCTWTVTLSDATGPVPISVSDFDTIDSFGNVFHPYVVPGQPAPPDLVTPGEKVTFELRSGEPVGEGLLRWAPLAGAIVAKWDFMVEND